jgi:hypothetical protein
MMNQPQIVKTQWPYFQKLLQYHDLEYYPTCELPDQWSGHQQKIKGFDQYNFLLDINLCFSSRPGNDVRDRTGQTVMPFQIYSPQWTLPVSKPESFDFCLNTRVNEILKLNQKINLLWSGGIDSTAMVVAFLKQEQCLDQLRIIHTVISRKENPFFFLLLQQYPQIEVIEIGGDFYMNEILDGVFVNAGAADDLLASIDYSFWKNLVPLKGATPWKKYFFEKNNSVEFINYCEEFFSRSGRPIETIIEARWWFYMICKMAQTTNRSTVIQDPTHLMTSFFDSKIFEDFMYYNTDKIIPGTEYNSYKKFIKDYILEFDGNLHYNKTKLKENSGQLTLYTKKRDILYDTQSIMWLSNGDRVFVDSLPFLSETVYRKKYGNSLNYLFNQ